MVADTKATIGELVGRHVALQRLQRELTQEHVATAAGVSRQALSAVERGVQVPSLGTLYAFAGALGCEVGDLIPTLRQVRTRAAAR